MLRETSKSSFDSSQLTLAQARFVIDRALADGKLSAGDLHRYHSSIDSHIRDLHRQIAALTESGQSAPKARRPRKRRKRAGRPAAGRPVAAAAEEGSARSTATAPPASKARKRAPLTITPERREMMRIQGQFLSCRRRLPVREQKRFTEAYKAARNPEEKAKIVRKMVGTLK
jgi:hypothetical protein